MESEIKCVNCYILLGLLRSPFIKMSYLLRIPSGSKKNIVSHPQRIEPRRGSRIFVIRYEAFRFPTKPIWLWIGIGRQWFAC